MSQREDSVTNLNRFLESAASLYSEQNSTKVSQILDDLSRTTGVLAEHRGDLGQSLAALEQVLTEAGALAEALNHLLDDDGRQTLASARETFDTLNRLMGDNQGSLDRSEEHTPELQ